MILALNAEGLPVLAKPGEHASCPDCSTRMLAKCGELIIWHWAHTPSDTQCRSRGETEWHRRWKMWALEEGCDVEVVRGDHRADIVTPTGLVVELQSGGLDADSIRARERAYGRMVWIFKITTEQYERIKWGREFRGGRGFRFKQGPKSLTLPNKPVYLDCDDGFGDELLSVSMNLVQSKYRDGQVMLGTAWSKNRRDVFEYGNIPPRVRALLTHLRANRDTEWYRWVVDQRRQRLGSDKI